MKKSALLFLFILVIGSSVFAQKSGSQELGGGVSFWNKTVNDTSETNLNIDGMWGLYINRDFIFEIEPRLTMNFAESQFDLTGLIMLGLSKRFLDMSNIDTNTGGEWARKYERTTAGIYGSISAGMWAERAMSSTDERIYVGPAFAVGLGTRSKLGSLTIMRVKFQYVYLMPGPPLHENPWSMFAVNVGLSVISKL